MVLPAEKTLKTNIQKNFPKSPKLARKISMVEFRHRQTILFRFSVISFHSNLDEKVTRNEQEITSKLRTKKVNSNKQIVTSNK